MFFLHLYFVQVLSVSFFVSLCGHHSLFCHYQFHLCLVSPDCVKLCLVSCQVFGFLTPAWPCLIFLFWFCPGFALFVLSPIGLPFAFELWFCTFLIGLTTRVYFISACILHDAHCLPIYSTCLLLLLCATSAPSPDNNNEFALPISCTGCMFLALQPIVYELYLYLTCSVVCSVPFICTVLYVSLHERFC